VVKKGRGKGAVIHVDRMRKLPSELSSDNSDSQEDDMHSTSQPKQQRKASDAAMATALTVQQPRVVQTQTLARLCLCLQTLVVVTRRMHACHSTLTFAIRQWMRAKVHIPRAWTLL